MNCSKRKPGGCAPPDPAGTFARAKVPKNRQPLGAGPPTPGALSVLRGVFVCATKWRTGLSASFPGPMVGEASAPAVLPVDSAGVRQTRHASAFIYRAFRRVPYLLHSRVSSMLTLCALLPQERVHRLPSPIKFAPCAAREGAKKGDRQ